MGASISGGSDVRYSVFESTGRHAPGRACVVVNYGDRAEAAEVAIAGAQGREAEISAPFEPDRRAKLPVKVTLPPHRCAVVVVR